MIITERFVFVHMHHTGGKAYRDELIHRLPEALEGDQSIGLTKGDIRDLSSEE